MARTTRSSSRVEAGHIDRSDPDHKAYLNEQKHIFSTASDYFVAEANETERALCAQLMLVDTVLLTGTLVAIANKDISDIFSIPVRILVLLALCALLLSIFFGVKYYFEVKKYNKAWARAKHRAMTTFLDGSIEKWSELRDKTNKLQADIPEEVEGPWLKLQILFIAIAAILYVVALFGFLFNVAAIFAPFMTIVNPCV